MRVLESLQHAVNSLLGRQTRRTDFPNSPSEREQLAEEIGEDAYELATVFETVKIELLNGECTPEEAEQKVQRVVRYMEERDE